MENKAVQMKLIGIVQGVGFRYFASRRAMHYRLTGYVKNLHDGSVEVWAEGPEDDLNSFINDVKKGPNSAQIMDAQIDLSIRAKGYRSFDIKF